MTSDCFTTFVYRRCLLVGALVNGAQEGKTILESQGGCHGQVVEKPIIHKCKQDIRFTCDGAYRYPPLSLLPSHVVAKIWTITRAHHCLCV